MESSTLDFDHKIIAIDSSNCTFTSDGTCNFYMNLDTPLRNVYKIKIITILINIQNSNVTYNNNLESIYIDLNNYKRLIANSSVELNGKRNNIYYFDSLIIESAVASGVSATSTIKNDYNNADIEYYLNPIEPQLTRFTVRLFDNNNNLITQANTINRFVMKLGIYYNNKKTTRI